jgi:hypothetical protein
MSLPSTDKEPKKVYLNRPQLLANIIRAQEKYYVLGRGLGKTSEIHAYDQYLKQLHLPRSKGGFVAASYAQLLMRILPAMIKGLEGWGLFKDVDYVIGRRPDKKLNFKEPFEPPLNWDYTILFRNGRCVQLISQDIKGSANGLNLDDIAGDEVKYLNYEQYQEEVLPTMRANEAYFSTNPLHWSILFTTSMPAEADAKWILKIIDKAKEGVNAKKVQLLEALAYQFIKVQGDCYRAVTERDKLALQRELKSIDAEMNKYRFNTIHTMEYSSLENMSVLTKRYIQRMKKIMDPFTFRTEILNIRPAAVDKCFYPLLKLYHHAYQPVYNNHYLQQLNYNLKEIRSKDNCLLDGDCNGAKTLRLSIDWGTNINSLSVFQYYDNEEKHEIQFINCLFVKWPKGIEDLARAFDEYYWPHPIKDIYISHDPKTGYEHRPNNTEYDNYVDQFCDVLRKRGWNVKVLTKGQLPEHYIRYVLFRKVLGEHDPNMPRIRFNKEKCKVLLNSMLNTPTKDYNGKIAKDKNSERNPNILQEEATHFGDTFDIAVHDILNNYVTTSSYLFESLY